MGEGVGGRWGQMGVTGSPDGQGLELELASPPASLSLDFKVF